MVMHFTGMLAFSLPVPVYYDVPTVVASHLAAVAASAAALHVASRQRLGAWAWWTGSVLMGGGIGVMHYTGMLALRLPGTMHHAPAMVALSVVLAVVVALVALRLTFKFRDGAGVARWRKPVSALVMGLAIPGLHYAAMAGASFISGDTLSGDMSHAVGSARLGSTALMVGTVVVLGLALLAAYADRRITAARQEKEQALRHSEARLRAILEAALDCIITIDHEGCIVEFNPAAERTFGYRRAEVIGKEMAALMVPPALREGHRRSLATGEGPLLDGRMETVCCGRMARSSPWRSRLPASAWRGHRSSPPTCAISPTRRPRRKPWRRHAPGSSTSSPPRLRSSTARRRRAIMPVPLSAKTCLT